VINFFYIIVFQTFSYDGFCGAIIARDFKELYFVGDTWHIWLCNVWFKVDGHWKQVCTSLDLWKHSSYHWKLSLWSYL